MQLYHKVNLFNDYCLNFYLGVPLASHSIFNLCEYPKSIISKRQKMSFKFPFGCGWLGSGCYGLRYRFGNPCGFIAHCYQNFQTFGASFSVLILSTMATRQCCGSLRSPHPPHPSRNSPPSPLFSKEKGDVKIVLFNCPPL
jgi:hypothetical protein